jgi:N4-gp56 family major capsid protein
MATATSSGVITYGALTTEQRVFYELNMLNRAVPNFLHLWFGLEGSVWPSVSLPLNSGHQIQWNKLGSLTANTTPLTEGVTPDPIDITVSTITGTVREYGSYIRYTRTLAQMGIHKVAAEASNALGEQCGDSLDLLTRATLVAETSNAQFANGRANTNSIVAGDYLTFVEIMKAVTSLKTNKAVAPMSGKFPAIIHPKGVYDLFSDPLMQAVLHYAKNRGDDNPLIRGYLGEAFGVSFWESPNAYYAANSQPINVYSTMVLGKGAFGVGGLAAHMPQIVKEMKDKTGHTFEDVRPIRMIDKPFGSTGTADPFDRLASIAWYTTFVAQILDASFYVRIEHATAIA